MNPAWDLIAVLVVWAVATFVWLRLTRGSGIKQTPTSRYEKATRRLR